MTDTQPQVSHVPNVVKDDLAARLRDLHRSESRGVVATFVPPRGAKTPRTLQGVAEPTPEPAEPDKPWYSRVSWHSRRIKKTGVILQQMGDLGKCRMDDLVVKHKRGSGMIQAGARYWNECPIPAGWVMFWFEGNPEPITHRDPVGLNNVDVEKYTGDYNLHLVGGALKGRIAPGLMRLLLIGGGVVVALVLGWFAYEGGYLDGLL